uniref:hypothetical protein n=1 Tax=Salmonella sp. s54925 TaxID=3159674 RepID=UPI00397F3C33
VPLALFIWHKFIQPFVGMWYGKKPITAAEMTAESQDTNITKQKDGLPMDGENTTDIISPENNREPIPAELSKDK